MLLAQLENLDVVTLSRWQFALTIMFHYLFPPLTIGMGVVLVYLEAMYLKSGDLLFKQAAKFWTGIFAVNFAIGVATGIVMEFEFGTNWATYSRFVGDVFGSALAAEGIFAFFLESGFLAILVFGWDRVGPKLHFFAACMVALGSIFSSVWIVIANSWQQTPAGHQIVQMTRDGVPWVVDGQPVMRAEIYDFWAMVFNPSTVQRLIHVWIGCFIVGAAMVMSISAWYLLRGKHQDFARRSLTGGLWLGFLACVAALASGHFQAKNVYRTQPAKLAAFEAHYETGPAAMTLLGVPNDQSESVDFAIAVPGGLSLLLHEDPNAEVIGLDRFRPEDRPPVLPSFVSYHLMIGFGSALLLLYGISVVWLFRGKLFANRWLLWLLVFSIVPATIANHSGWVAAEVGRQPFVVYPPLLTDASGGRMIDDQGHFAFDESQGLRTANAVSRSVEGSEVLASIVMFGLVYVALFFVWISVLHHKIQKGPEPVGLRKSPENETGFIEAATAISRHEEGLMGDRDEDAEDEAGRSVEQQDSGEAR